MEAGAPARDEEDCACCQCRPQLFTSVMLGALACVLVTGGVFLAFHKWDQMWLLVSAVGVVLIAVGTTLHCCSNNSSPQQHGSHKTRPHVIPSGDNGLTEHLLPLSNARSVSQLSLNMVPSYFPAYTIEQHSAVVQNINRIMQSNGKSFLLLPIPGDTNSAQLQSLVATVYHLDGSTSTTEESTGRETQAADMSSQTTEVSLCPGEQQPPTPNTTSTAVEASSSIVTSPPAVKHAEVQTCNDWQAMQQNGRGSEAVGKSTSSITNPDPSEVSHETVIASHCSQLEDNTARAECEENRQCTTQQLQTSDSPDVIEAIETVFTVSPGSTVCDTDDHVIQPECSVATTSATTAVSDDDDAIVTDTLPAVSDIPLAITDPSQLSPETEDNPSCNIPVVPTEASSTFEMVHTVVMADVGDLQDPPSQYTDLEVGFGDEHSEDILMDSEEAELFGRSSPPPSYEEVTQENQVTIGAFGLAYGTI